MATKLEVRLLGSHAVYLDGKRCHIPLRKAEAVLYYTILEPDEHSRAKLAVLLWPNHKAPRGRLANALWYLRKAISTEGDPEAGNCFIHSTRDTIRFNFEHDAVVDAAEFEQLLHEAGATPCIGPHEREKIRQAVALYSGPLLQDFLLDDECSDYNDWIIARQREAERHYLAALQALVLYAAAQREYDQALRWLREYLRNEPYDELLHCLAMLLHVIRGEPHLALRHFDLHREVLEALGVTDLTVSASVLHQLISSGQPTHIGLVESIEAVLTEIQLDVQPNVRLLMGRILDRLDLDIHPVESQEVLQVLQRARETAKEMGFSCLGAPHIFLALLELWDKATDELLRRVGLRRAYVEESLRMVLGRGQGPSEQEIKPSPHCQCRLDRARERAMQAKALEIQTHHLLEAILEDHWGLVVRLIKTMGVGPLILDRYVSR